MVVSRFDVYLVSLDPTIGSEIKKTRPCLIVSPDEMNAHIATVLVAPMTTQLRGRFISRRKRGGVGSDPPSGKVPSSCGEWGSAWLRPDPRPLQPRRQ
jgi:mRNA-degrading endonuclease toxin of MazEF toxin-antitoxin module